MTRISFTRRPVPILVEHRPLYKIAQILIVLRVASRGNKSSLLRLHLFNWALKNNGRLNMLKLAAHTDQLSIPAWGVDPALAIALRFAVAESLICTDYRMYQATSKGISYIDSAIQAGLFTEEIVLLKTFGKSITEKMVDAVAKNWT